MRKPGPKRRGYTKAPPPKPPHRPVYDPTPETRRQVTVMTGFGISQIEISNWLHIDVKTLRKHFRHELDTGVTEANLRVATSLFKMATSGQIPAATIWWTKARMGWKEAHDVNVGGQDNNPVRIGIDQPPRETREQWLERRDRELRSLVSTPPTIEGKLP
jgi:hypothetical protein